MTPRELEKVYETMALALDATHPGKRETLLAKLVLLLAQDLDDADRVCLRIDEAGRNLDV